MEYLTKYKLNSKISLSFHLHQFHSPHKPGACVVPIWYARGARWVLVWLAHGVCAVCVWLLRYASSSISARQASTVRVWLTYGLLT